MSRESNLSMNNTLLRRRTTPVAPWQHGLDIYRAKAGTDRPTKTMLAAFAAGSSRPSRPSPAHPVSLRTLRVVACSSIFSQLTDHHSYWSKGETFLQSPYKRPPLLPNIPLVLPQFLNHIHIISLLSQPSLPIQHQPSLSICTARISRYYFIYSYLYYPF